jgi:hypothetical protein
MLTPVRRDSLWGIWCVEWKEWCTRPDDTPWTFPSEAQAKLAADDWQKEHDWQVANGIRPARAGIHDPRIGDGPMVPLTFKAAALVFEPKRPQ